MNQLKNAWKINQAFFKYSMIKLFVALFAMYLGPNIKQQNVESFEPGLEKEVDLEPVNEPVVESKGQNQLDDIMNQINASVSGGGGGSGGGSGSEGGIDDLFGKLEVGDYEDSDDDSDEDEDEVKLEKKAGKTTVSSKNAYKAQKQLYDLNVTANALNMTITKMAPTLQKGQKIIERLKGLGIEKYL